MTRTENVLESLRELKVSLEQTQRRGEDFEEPHET